MNQGMRGMPALAKGWRGVFLVANLPAGVEGDFAYASDCRSFDGAGVQQSAGVGTGSLVSCGSASIWKIVGTHITAVA